MSVSEQDFNTACKQFHRQWQREQTNGSWPDAKLHENFGSHWLRFTCVVHRQRETRDTDVEQNDAPGDAVDEEDLEALPVSPRQGPQPLVIYDVIHSPSYQVPVLYITFKDLPSISRGLPPPEQVYKLLVPASYLPQIDGMGPMGALSMTDHPITATPAYFVHPCRTAEAMQAVTGGKTASPEEYLLKWVGVIGQSVGLSVPSEIARAFVPASGIGEEEA